MAGGKQALAAKLAEAHRALRADASVQFDLVPATPPTPPPAWVGTLGRFLHRIFAPIGRALGWLFSFLPDAAWVTMGLYAVLALLAAALLWMIVVRLREGAWRWPRRRRAGSR